MLGVLVAAAMLPGGAWGAWQARATGTRVLGRGARPRGASQRRGAERPLRMCRLRLELAAAGCCEGPA